jgi:hypothetical protein
MLKRASNTLDSMNEDVDNAINKTQQSILMDAKKRQRKTSQKRRNRDSNQDNTSAALSGIKMNNGRFRPILLDPVFPPVAPPGAPPTLMATKEPKWPLVYDYMEHRVELSGHEISIFTANGRPNSKRDSAPWRGAVPTREKK